LAAPAHEPGAATHCQRCNQRRAATGQLFQRGTIKEEKRSRGMVITKMQTIVKSTLSRAAIVRRRSSSISSFAHGVARRLF
jgi:hypothetical protein